MVGKMVNPQDSYLLFPISQMKQFLDLHLDFFLLDELSPWRWNWNACSWQRFCEAICLIICTLRLWETLRRLCFSLYQEGRDFSSSWVLHSGGLQVSHMPGLFPARRWDSCSFPQFISEKALTSGKDSGNGMNVKERASVLREGFSVYRVWTQPV